MKNIFKIAMGAALAAAAVASAAPKYPFPQNMKHPHGNIIEYADIDMIKEHFNAWKGAWYDASRGWILSPEGTGSTVSEGIAYGMLISVYMDDGTNGAKEMFDKLYNTWKSNAVGGSGAGKGMNWRVGEGAQGGSASDADFDAALALIMASVQWSDNTYMDDAKKLLSWLMSNDINGNHIKPGSGWNDMFNPSYATVASFELFKGIDNSWDNVLSTAFSDLSRCQNDTSGLVADWHTWGSYTATLNGNAAVGQPYTGFYDDAARTPWRTAWSYYWYGNQKAKAFNDKIVKWLYPVSHNLASEINSGYSHGGKANTAASRSFASSTFSGGLGLVSASDETEAGQKYLGTVYSYLATKKSCATANGCGEGSVAGEKYYPSTLNLLYLLLMTGNMPNFYSMNGFTAFVPDPSKAPSMSELEGTQMAKGDTTIGLSGFWNWGAYHDKYGSTTMNPDSGTSPLFYKDGMILAEASMKIGPEPLWTQEKADVCKNTPSKCELLYPSAGIAMAFLADEKKGVNFNALGITAVRVTMKASGPIRMAVLNEITYENDARKINNAGAGTEPGVYVPNSTDYLASTYSLTPCDYGFLGLANACVKKDSLYQIIPLNWADKNAIPLGEEILPRVTGLKFEVKQSEGGIGDISIKSIEFLKADGTVVDPAKIAGFSVGSTPSVIPGSSSSGSNPAIGGSSDSNSDMAIGAPAQLNMAKISTSGMNITVSGAPVNADIAVFNMQGKVIASTKAFFGMAQSITVPNKGVYMVRVGNKMSKIAVK